MPSFRSFSLQKYVLKNFGLFELNMCRMISDIQFHIVVLFVAVLRFLFYLYVLRA